MNERRDIAIIGSGPAGYVQGELQEIRADGLFVAIGRTPATSWLRGQLALDAERWLSERTFDERSTEAA